MPRSGHRMQQPPHAAAEEMPPRNALRPPVNECGMRAVARGDQHYQYYGSPSRSAVRRKLLLKHKELLIPLEQSTYVRDRKGGATAIQRCRG
ncbi:unnamed protein product [Arctogadus glacialis]